MGDFTYPPGSSAAVNRDQGTIDVTAPNGGPVSHIKSDGSEETKLANGADVTRQAPGSQIVTHYQLGGKDLIDANGNWVADAPGGLGGKKASDYEVDPANGNVTNKGHLDQVVAGVSDGKLIAGDTLPQNGLPPGVELPKVPGMPAAGDVKTTTVKDGVITVTTNKGDTIQYTQGKDDFKYTVAGGKTFDFHKNNDGGWTAMEDGPGHDILSINALRIDNGVVRFSEKNPLAADDHMMITKDGGIVEEPRH